MRESKGIKMILDGFGILLRHAGLMNLIIIWSCQYSRERIQPRRILGRGGDTFAYLLMPIAPSGA